MAISQLLYMSIFAISCLAVAILSIVLGGLVYIRNKSGKINRSWFFVTFSIFCWSLSFWGVVTAKDQNIALFWQRILDISGIFIPITFLDFVLVLLDENKSQRYKVKIYLIYLIGIIFSVISLFPIFKIGMKQVFNFPYWINPGPLYFIFPGMFFTLVIYFSYLLFKNYFKLTGLKKIQIGYVLLASIVGFGGGITDFFPQLIQIYPVGHYFVAFYVVFISYAISRYRLMEIKTIIKRSSVFALLVMLIGATFVLLSSLISNMIAILFNETSNTLTALFVAIIITLIFQPLKNFLEKITDKFLFTKGYNPSLIISRITDLNSSITNLDLLLSSTSEVLNDTFYYSKIAIILLDEKKKLKIEYQKGLDIKNVSQFIRGKERDLKRNFSETRNIKVIDELRSSYEAGEYKPQNIKLIYQLYDLDIALVIPLFVKDKLTGIIALGNKKSGDPYNNQDLQLLSIIAGQSAVSIENAKLYDELQDFNVKLQKEVKKATAKLEVANKELQRLDQSKSEFLSIASHQLRTPLTVIKGYSSMILEGSFGRVPKLIKENMDKVFNSTERLIALVENLLNVSRIEAGRIQFDLEPVDLESVVKVFIDDFTPKAEAKKIKLSFYPEKKLPKVLADPQKIKDVISNLLDNSIKYTPTGEITVSLHLESQSVVFACQDTGMGIDPNDLPRLFNKFVRGTDMNKVQTDGTGLGLYYARMIVENMGGRIWAESNGKGKGSKFCFSLNLANKGEAKKM